jgi:predicted DNA-binding transcriptional regulator AlpA
MLNLLQRICFLLEATYQLLKEATEKQNDHTQRVLEKEEPSLQDNELLDIQQVREILRIGRSTYYRFVNEGKLTPRKIGGRPCYYLADLDEMIKESKRRWNCNLKVETFYAANFCFDR